jgi:hypothetical protein
MVWLKQSTWFDLLNQHVLLSITRFSPVDTGLQLRRLPIDQMGLCSFAHRDSGQESCSPSRSIPSVGALLLLVSELFVE